MTAIVVVHIPRYDNGLAVLTSTELDADIAMGQRWDDEIFDLDNDNLSVPLPAGDDQSLTDRYRALLANPDPAIRAMAAQQLARLKGGRRGDQDGDPEEQPPPDLSTAVGGLLDVVAVFATATGRPFRCRRGGVWVGPCPFHGSASGECLVLWASRAVWWCSSCRRAGDVVAFRAAFDGTDYQTARRALGLPRGWRTGHGR